MKGSVALSMSGKTSTERLGVIHRKTQILSQAALNFIDALQQAA
ncbi:hypothetical protein [Bordetella petrii]|nr:hypothetical protein [Bordetella petrii]